jgi:hypothetical protein
MYLKISGLSMIRLENQTLVVTNKKIINQALAAMCAFRQTLKIKGLNCLSFDYSYQ